MGWNDFFTGAGGAVVNAGAAVGVGFASAGQNKHARGWQRRERRRSQNWQEDMRGNRIRTTVKDMKLAGINPILAMGSGGMTPGPASAGSPSASQGTNFMGAAGSAAAGATAGMAVRNMSKQNKILEENLAEAGYRAHGVLMDNTIKGPKMREAVWKSNYLTGHPNKGNSAEGDKYMHRKMQIDLYAPAASAGAQLINAGSRLGK